MIRHHGPVAPIRLAELEAFVASQRITEHVFRDMDAARIRVTDIVAMDEYTIELVFRLPDGLWLVYDTT